MTKFPSTQKKMFPSDLTLPLDALGSMSTAVQRGVKRALTCCLSDRRRLFKSNVS